MKNIFTVILALCILYLSSCYNSSGGNNSTLIPTPVVDSQSKGGNIQVTFINDSSVTENFFINDYTLNGKPGYSLYATVVYNHTDSLWHLNLQAIDQKTSRVALIFNGTDTAASGTFTNTANTSTFTDYTNGHTITYSILVGSTVNITQSSYPIQGTFAFNLSHNYFTTLATGSFIVYY
jgi:hypothetical protein